LEGLGKPRTEPIKLPRIEAELSWLVSDYPFDDIYIPDPEFFVPQIPPPPMVRRCKHCGQEPGTDRHPDCRSNPDRGADGANHEDVVSVDAASIIGMDVGEESSFSIGIKIPPGMAEAFKKMADVGKDLGASFDAMADVGKDLGASFDAMAVKIGEMVSALTGKNAPKTWPQVYKEHKYLKRMASRRKHHAHRRRKR
jgi:hypothetical protein